MESQTNTADQVVIWNFEWTTGTWNKIAEISADTWMGTEILGSQILTCDADSKRIELLELETWSTISVIQLPSTFDFQCNFQDFKEFRDPSGNVWAIFEGVQAESQEGLWAILLQPQKEASPQIVFDYDSIPGTINALSYFSFSPVRSSNN